MNQLIDLTLFTTTFVTLFVIIDPPGLLPVYLGLTATMTAKERRSAAVQATVTSFVIIMAFTLFGTYIFAFLHISVPALQASGGLLLLLVSMQLLTGVGASAGREATANVAMVPLGTPLLAGPGAIVAATLAISSAGAEPARWVAVLAAIVLMHLVIWLVMRFSTVLHRLLREAGVTLLTRISGMLLAAIAVQLLADGVRGFIAGG